MSSLGPETMQTPLPNVYGFHWDREYMALKALKVELGHCKKLNESVIALYEPHSSRLTAVTKYLVLSHCQLAEGVVYERIPIMGTSCALTIRVKLRPYRPPPSVYATSHISSCITGLSTELKRKRLPV